MNPDLVGSLLKLLPIPWIENNLYHPDGFDEKIKLRDFQEYLINKIYTGGQRHAYCTGRQLGKSVTIAMIAWHYAVALGRRVVIVTPGKANLETIWDKIDSLIKYNENLKSMIIKEKHTPYNVIKLSNNGEIKGVITGSQEGKESISARGITGSDIFCDEAAYIPASAWKIITPYVTNTPNAKLLLFSTPSEWEDFFWEAFHKDELKFAHEQFPSPLHNPNWNDDMEKLQRIKMTDDEYNREIMAQFPSSTGGIFPEKLAKRSARDYMYSTEKKQGYKYVFGVDWNTSENGVQIYSIGFNSNDFYVQYREVIGNIENVQTHAINRIIELNNIIDPEYIFADAGYGSTQLEILHQYGINNPMTRLDQKVKSIDFNSSDTVRIVINKEIVKKKPKPFMIDLIQKLVQDNRFSYSKPEDYEGKYSLYAQMRSFKKKRKGFGTVIVYEDGYYHGLISVGIALLGIYKYYSPFSADCEQGPSSYISFDSAIVFDPAFLSKIKPVVQKPLTPDQYRAHDPEYKEFSNFLDGKQTGYTRSNVGKPTTRGVPSNWSRRNL